MVQHAGIDEAADIQECVGLVAQSHEGAYPVALLIHDKGHLARSGALDGPSRHGVELQRIAEAGAAQHLTRRALEQHYLGHAAQGAVRTQHAVKKNGILEHQRLLARDVLPHDQNVGANGLLLFVEIGL